MSTKINRKRFVELLRTIIKREIKEASTTATAGGEYDTPHWGAGSGSLCMLDLNKFYFKSVTDLYRLGSRCALEARVVLVSEPPGVDLGAFASRVESSTHGLRRRARRTKSFVRQCRSAGPFMETAKIENGSKADRWRQNRHQDPLKTFPRRAS